MADLNAKIIPLRTETEGLAPTSAQLDVGEIATNITDRKIYTKDSDGNIVVMGAGADDLSVPDLADVDAASVQDEQVLAWNEATQTWVPKTLNSQLTDDPYWGITEALVTGDGLQDGTTVYPNLADGASTTATGSGATTALSKWGTSAIQTTSDLGPIVYSMGDKLGNVDWTVEGWFYYDAADWSSYTKILSINGYSSPFYTVRIENDNNSQSLAKLSISNNGSVIQNTSGVNALVANEWQHIAMVRHGNTFSMYFNGQRKLSMNSSVSIGSDTEENQIIFGYNCKGVNDFRFTRGLARYTEATVEIPTQALTAPQSVEDGSGLPGGDYEPNTESPDFFRWEFDGHSCAPAAGYAGWCSGGWDLVLSVTDADGLNREGALYALESGDPFRIVLADGTEIFNGLLSAAGNKESDRITLALDDDPDQEGSGVSSLVDEGDDIYIELTPTNAVPGGQIILPVVDGDILRFDGTNWRNVPRGVESVQGKAGNVRLTIQEMDDFELNESTVNAVRFPTFLTSGNPEDEGEWQMTTVGVAANSLSYSGAGGLDTEMGQLQVGDVVTIQWSDGSTTDYTIDQAQAHNSGVNGKYIRFTTDHTVPPAVLSGELIIFSSRFSNPIIAPLVEGELLKWDSTAERWVPGVPEMRIQEASDFELNSLVASSHRYTLMPDTDAAWPTVAAGQYAVASDGSWLRFNYEDADGNTVAFTASADIWTTTNLAGSWTTGDANTTQDTTPGVRYFFRSAGAAISADLGATTYLSLIDPAAPTYATLAEGDILQWADADQKFKPQNFSGLVGAVKLNDLQDVEALAPSNGQVLTYDEPNSEWIASTSTIDALADVDTTTASPATGQALTWDGSNWTPGMAVDDLGRITVTHSIPSLAQNASEDVDQSGVGTAGIILNLTTDVSCWVVAYVSKAARTADGSRLRTEDPESGSGVVAEFVTSGAETVIATPPPTYFNGEASPVDQIYLRVTNLGVTAPVTYDLTVSRTEP